MIRFTSPEQITLSDATLPSGYRSFVRYIPEEVIDDRTDALAEQILGDYGGRPIHLIHLAFGGVFWATDLARALRFYDPEVELTQDLLRLGSYGQLTVSSGIIRQFGDLGNPGLIEGNNVILVDEVVDTGRTIGYMRRMLEAGIRDSRGSKAPTVRPATLAIASLTNKVSVHDDTGSLGTTPTVNYPGFEVPDIWLVGRGMDHEEQGRELVDVYRSMTPSDPATVEPYRIPATISPFSQRLAA